MGGGPMWQVDLAQNPVFSTVYVLFMHYLKREPYLQLILCQVYV
jgi:hypothetical protein